MSVEQTRGRLDCGLQGVNDTVSKERFRGIRIFDITDVRKPRQVAAVQTCRGSHTHTLVPDPGNPSRIFVYGSGTSSVRPGEELEGCSGKDAKEDPNTSLFSIDVIEVPLGAPQNAKIVNRPRIFMDETTGNLAGLWQGGNHGEGTQTSRMTNQCHDITVYSVARTGGGRLLRQRHPAGHLRSAEPQAARSRRGQGLRLLALRNFQQRRHQGRVHRRVGRRLAPALPRDRSADLGRRRHLRHRRPQAPVPRLLQDAGGADRAGELRRPQRIAHPGAGARHHGAVVVPGRHVGVRLHRLGRTRSRSRSSIAARSTARSWSSGGYWSSYYYNGFIYAAEIARGLDILRLVPGEHLTQNELDAASLVRWEEFNSQNQPKVTWPTSIVVARAYLDQLKRSKAVTGARADAIQSRSISADRVSGRDRGRPRRPPS